MKHLHFLLICLCFTQYSLADTSNLKFEYDSVRIGHIPSKDAHHNGEPHVTLEAKVLAHHQNRDIKSLFMALSNLAAEGRTDNATQFHAPTVYIEAIHQGKQVRLFFSGNSNLSNLRHYEQQWKLLHGSILKYINTKITSEYQFIINDVK